MASQVITHRDRSPLTREELLRVTPSVLAEEPHERTSSRYLYVSTAGILDALEGEGFLPVWASEQRTRDASRRGYTRHMVRLAHRDELARYRTEKRKVGDRMTEVVLTNAHDASSSIQGALGVFRLACLNGMMVAESTVEDFRIRHSAKWRDDIIEGVWRVVGEADKVDDQIGAMSGRELEGPERALLAAHASSLRWPGGAPIEPEALLTPRRPADNRRDAWTTLNVLQEHVMRGGDRYVLRDGRGRVTQSRQTQPVTGLDGIATINRGLWESVSTLASTSRVDLAEQVFARLSPEERGQVAARLA